MELRHRLENTTERAVLFQIIKDVQNNPGQNIMAVEAFCDSIDCFSKFLTDKEYFPILTPIIDTQCPLQTIIGLSRSMPAVSSIRQQTTFRDVMTVLAWLKYTVEKYLSKAICDSLKVIDESDEACIYAEFAISCMNLPEKIANCSAKAMNDEHIKYINTIKWMYKMNILQAIQQALTMAHDSLSSAVPQDAAPNLKTVSELMSAGRNMDIGPKHVLLGRMMEWIGNLEEFDAKWRQMMHKIFQEPTVQGVQVHEALLTSVFLTAKNDKTLMRCIEVTDLTGILRRVVMVKLPFQRILTFRTIKILVNFVHQTQERLGIELLETALKIWSDVNYAKRAPEPQERHIVRIIVYSIYLFTKNKEKTPTNIAWDSLFIHSMKGVHTRMEMLPTYIQSALFINETLSKLSSEHRSEDSTEFDGPPPPPPPKNEEYKKDWTGVAWLEEMKSILEEGVKTSKPTLSRLDRSFDSDEEVKDEDEERDCIEQEGERGDVEVQVAELQGQQEANNSAAEDSEEEEETTNAQRLQNHREQQEVPEQPALPLDSDDEEDFPAYDVDAAERQFNNLEVGEEPRNKVAPPSYIADAYEMLLEKEKYEVFEAAFFNITSLINRRAVGFPQIAEKLFVRVIHLQNNFGTQRFNETIDEIAVACITQRPEIVPALVRLIIAPGQGYRLQQRLIHYIHMAADEMGVLDRRNEQFIVEQQAKMGGVTMHLVQNEDAEVDYDDERDDRAPRTPEWRHIVEARIAANTRRLGTTRERPRAGVVNRLAVAAKYMFYPLLVLPRGEHARLLGKESDLLSYIIMVASMVYVRCGVNPAVAKMSTELISYVTPHRFSENAKLRTACLAAHLNVVALLPPELLADRFSAETRQEWADWCEAITGSHTTQELEFEMAKQLSIRLGEPLPQRHIGIFERLNLR